MPGWSAVTLGGILALSFIIPFFYQIGVLYGNCTEENNCISCSVTLSESAGTCSPLANPSLQVVDSCFKVELPNNTTYITALVKNLQAKIVDYNKVGFLSTDLFNSLNVHSQGVLSMIGGNSFNQIIDPDVKSVTKFLSTNYMGFSDAFGSSDSIASSSKAAIQAAGLKVMFSYLSIGCAIVSSQESRENSTFPFETTQVEEDQENLTFEATLFPLCGCAVGCPSVDGIPYAVGSMDVSMPSERLVNNGLSFFDLVLPNKYIQTPNPKSDPPYYDALATAEMVMLMTTDGTLKAEHCPASIFISTPSSLNTVFHRCCVEKTALEKLSESYAFAGLVFTIAVSFTTVLFWRLQPASVRDGKLLLQQIEALKENFPSPATD